MARINTDFLSSRRDELEPASHSRSIQK